MNDYGSGNDKMIAIMYRRLNFLCTLAINAVAYTLFFFFLYAGEKDEKGTFSHDYGWLIGAAAFVFYRWWNNKEYKRISGPGAED